MKRGQDRVTSHTEAEWSALDPVLFDGEIGINRNGGRMKYGDGLRTWSQLPYMDQNFATTTDIATVDAAVSAVSTAVGVVSDGADTKINGVRQQVITIDARVSALEAKINTTTVVVGP